MHILFDKVFVQSLNKIKNKKVKIQLLAVIEKVEQAHKLKDIPNIKKLVGFKNFYRIRIGDYRLGFELEPLDVVRFIIFCHRKDIYRKFP